MEYQTHEFSNGIRLIHKPDKTTAAYCGLIINAGTRDEADTEQGMAHFIEHMLFKGTVKRRATHIINRLEDVGGELNAYTNKEETVVYAAVLNEDFERAMELIADISFNSIFPEKEIEKEIEVVLDEIQSYKDNPSELIFDDFEEIIFAGSSLGHNILGNAKLLKKYTRENILDFLEKNYNTDEMVFFSLGDIDFKKIIRWGEKYLGSQKENRRTHSRQTPKPYIAQQKNIHKDTHQLHLMLGSRAYSLNDPNRIVLSLLNNILGGPGMNSLLNLALRERHGLAYNVESNYTAYSDTGLFSIYLGSDPKNQEKCMHLIHKELESLRENQISENKLSKYKKQWLGQLCIGHEQKESLALSLGKSFLNFNCVESIDEIKKKIERITTKDLQQVANEIFDKNNLSSLIYH